MSSSKAQEAAPEMVLIAAGGLLLLLVWWSQGFPPPGEFLRSAPVWFKVATYWTLVGLVQDTLLNPIFWVLTCGILFLERLFPARPSQPILSIGLAQDAVWFLLAPILSALIIATYATALGSLYREHFSFLTIGAIGQLPAWACFAWAVVLLDFLSWFHHWVRHKVPAFWQFHTVHHSQRDMNLFTDLRYHVVEYLIARTITSIPLLMLAVDTPTVFYFSLLHAWFTRLYHSNIRTDFGPLRYILVTPQSHRIHHSIDPKHQDKNFGVLFSVWDQMFGTQYRGWHEYPETGIADETFPSETTVRGLALLRTPIRQHIYPFLSLYRTWRGPSPQRLGP